MAVLGALGALPPLCFAGGALVAHGPLRALPIQHGILVALTGLSVGLAGRAAAPDAGWLLVASLLVFVSLGLLNVLLPPFVKARFRRRGAAVTGLYITLMGAGTFAAPLIAVPLADAGGWRFSLATWAGLAAVAALIWLPLLRTVPHVPRGPADAGRPFSLRLPDALRSPVWWGICALCATPGFTSYAMFAWFPTITADTTGTDPASAGAVLAFYASFGTPAALLLPLLIRFRHFPFWLIAGCGASFVVGFCGLLLAPTHGLLVWAALCGLGQTQFPLSLILMNARARTAAGTALLSTTTQAAAYLTAALGPVLIGALHDATGGWSAPLALLAVVAGAGSAAALLAAPPRFIEDARRR